MSTPARPRRRVTTLCALVISAALAVVSVGSSAAPSAAPESATQPAVLAEAASAPAAPAPAASAPAERYLVLAAPGADESGVRAAVSASGGAVTGVNSAVGLFGASLTAEAAAVLETSDLISGVAKDRPVGRVPGSPVDPFEASTSSPDAASALPAALPPASPATAAAPALASGRAAPVGDPLSSRQWDMAMMNVPAAHAVTRGAGVLVGVMDTGIDASHPDLAGRVNLELSRNFTRDMPEVDGPCAAEPDRSCDDPASVDENEHGTHVAGIIAAGRNGRGVVGVAPEATLVNLRTGQDSGLFFLTPTVNALTYAGDARISVVNMSYFIDPWLFNCPANRADSAAEQREQRTIIEATNRALQYASSRGVTVVAAAGNEHVDLDNPKVDTGSPDYPEGKAKTRTLDSTCVVLPAQGAGVLTVSAVGPSRLKSDYSNWGRNSIDIAAPGGYTGDYFGTTRYARPDNLILAPMPKAIALASGEVDTKTGRPDNPRIVAECRRRSGCDYYQYLEGTSMAAPHVAGAAALVAARFGRPADGAAPGGAVAARLLATARDTACRARTYDYPDLGPDYTSRCTGPATRNSWYGEGIVDAAAAVGRG